VVFVWEKLVIFRIPSIRSLLNEKLGYTENMKINKEWHLKNKMPKNPTLEQGIKWHVEHARNCQCRKLGGKILEEIKKRGIKL
jgi:hypothetical protein